MPLSKSPSNKAFKKNVSTEMKAGKPQKQALAIAYATKRNSKAYGGKIEQTCPDCQASGSKCSLHAIEHEMPEGYQETKDVPMSEGGMAEYEGAKPDHSGKDLLAHRAPMARNMNKQKYAEGGAVNDKRPLQTDPENDNLELDEQLEPSDSSHIDPGISSAENSHDEQDLPRVSEALSLAADIMADRKRRRMAEGGKVNHQEDMKLSGDGRAMQVGSLEDGIDEPTMSDLSNNSDEMNAESADGRESRGMSISVPHVMSDDEHDESEASQVEDYKDDDSLIGEILRDRKMRRRG